MDEWNKVSFGSLIENEILEIGDGYRAKLSELGGDGPLFLRAGNLKENGFDWVESDRFQEDLIYKLDRKIGKPGDTIITTKGNSVGRTGYVPSDSPVFVYSPHLSYWRSVDTGKISPRFLRYWSRSPEFVEQLRAFAYSTDMAPYLSLLDQRSLEISLPRVEVQNAIASVLGALDDKIAVNERIRNTAKDLVAEILESFLVKDISVTSVRLGDISDINRRKVKPLGEGYLRYLDISCVSSGQIDWPSRISWHQAPSRARRAVSRGDTIWSTVRPGRRSHALLLEDDSDLVASTGFAVLTPKNVGPAYLYEITKRDAFVQYLESVAEGSAYPAVRAQRFENAVVPLLSAPVLREFEERAIALHTQAHAAEQESRTLAQLRDTLLPKLMSGELRVKDAEKLVEEAT